MEIVTSQRWDIEYQNRKRTKTSFFRKALATSGNLPTGELSHVSPFFGYPFTKKMGMTFWRCKNCSATKTYARWGWYWKFEIWEKQVELCFTLLTFLQKTPIVLQSYAW